MSKYTVMQSTGTPDHRCTSKRAARAHIRQAWGWDRVYLAESYQDSEGRWVWEAFRALADLRAHPDGDPYAPAIRQERA